MPPSYINRRSIIVFAAGVVIVIVGIPQISSLASNHDVLRAYDFVQYWTAGRQLLDGKDPYDPDELLKMQREMWEGHQKTVMMWNPPWTLPLTLPFAALPWRTAQLLWIGLQLACVLLAVDLLWRLYGGNPRFRWVSWLVALSFAPTLFLLMMGQISGWQLLGLTGFLYFVRKERHVAAGCCVTLTAIKPHLLPLLALFLALEALHRRSTRRAVLAGVGILLISGLLPLLWNANVWTQYFQAMRHPPSASMETMQQFEHPTIGYEIRRLIPNEPFAAQFIPVAIASILAIPYWLVRRRTWNWGREMPLIVLASLLTAAYGAWAFDLVLLLLPITLMVVWMSSSWNALCLGLAAALYLVLNGLVLRTIREAGSQANPWITPAVVLAFLTIAVVQRVFARKFSSCTALVTAAQSTPPGNS